MEYTFLAPIAFCRNNFHKQLIESGMDGTLSSCLHDAFVQI